MVSFQSLPCYPQANWALWFPGRWVCIRSRTLWFSPMNSPVRLGFSPAATTPTGFYGQRFWGFISPCLNPGLHGLSHSSFVPPHLSACECEMPSPPAAASPTLSSSCCPASSLGPLHPAAISTPPTALDECFFNSLFVRLSYSLIFWLFWLFFVFKFVVVLLLVVQGGTVCLPAPSSWHLGWKVFFSVSFFLFLG